MTQDNVYSIDNRFREKYIQALIRMQLLSWSERQDNLWLMALNMALMQYAVACNTVNAHNKIFCHAIGLLLNLNCCDGTDKIGA